MLRKKNVGLFFSLIGVCLCISACGKKENKGDVDFSVWDNNMCLIEDGMLYHDPDSDKVSYLDYKTREYFPLCSRANCLHDSLECTAVYLNKATMAIGRLKDKWYYLKLNDDFTATFYSCNLDGGNEKEVGDFSHSFMWADNRAIFYEDSCILSTWDWNFDEETGEGIGFISGLFRYYFEDGEAELLCPEKQMDLDENGYSVYGVYNSRLVYSEWVEEASVLRMMDLKTKEVFSPLGDFPVRLAFMGKNLLVCVVLDGENWKIVELNLDSGEKKEFPEPKEGVMKFFWMPKLKVFVTYEKADGKDHYRLYQGMEEECVKIREGGGEQYFMPDVLYEDMVVGLAGEGWSLSYMTIEDFLTGKSNWTEYSRK